MQGRADVRKVASFIRPLKISVEHIWHSGKLRAAQTAQILAKLRPGHSIALDDRGSAWTSADWATQLQHWMREYSQVNLIIGGPDGLAPQCLQACQQRVSLGRMTMPHALVKLVLIEQLYRAWTISQGHPYHRE